jgi:hypothetical protein
MIFKVKVEQDGRPLYVEMEEPPRKQRKSITFGGGFPFANPDLTVPRDKIWQIDAVQMAMSCDATVATRYPRLVINGNAGAAAQRWIAQLPTVTGGPANTLSHHSWLRGISPYSTVINSIPFCVMPLPEQNLYYGDGLQLVIDNMQAGDSGGVRIRYWEWDDTT